MTVTAVTVTITMFVFVFVFVSILVWFFFFGFIVIFVSLCYIVVLLLYSCLTTLSQSPFILTLINLSPPPFLPFFIPIFYFSSLILTDSTIQKIENILEISCPKGDELYISDKISMTKAVLIGTLHGDDVLTASIYKLLTKQMTYQNGIACISNSVTLVPTDKVRCCVCVCASVCGVCFLVIQHINFQTLRNRSKKSNLLLLSLNLIFAVLYLKYVRNPY